MPMKKVILLMSVCLIMVITLPAQQFNGTGVQNTSDRYDAGVRPQKAIQQDVNVQKESSYKEVYSYNLMQRLELLESKHKMFYGLPYPQDYISNTVMPSIRAERKNVAPGFPERTANIASDKENINYWLENNTEEFIQYLNFLDDKYMSLKNAVK
jgi:hypothetical protein